MADTVFSQLFYCRVITAANYDGVRVLMLLCQRDDLWNRQGFGFQIADSPRLVPDTVRIRSKRRIIRLDQISVHPQHGLVLQRDDTDNDNILPDHGSIRLLSWQ